MLQLTETDSNGRIIRSRVIRLNDIDRPITIGRSKDCDYQLRQVPYLSRVQCTIERHGDDWILRDGNGKRSEYGVWSEHGRVQELILKTGVEAELFKSTNYMVKLSMTDEIYVDRDTAEYPAQDLHDQVRGLREGLIDLKNQVAALCARQTEHQQAFDSQVLGAISELKDQVGALRSENRNQDCEIGAIDRHVKRVLAGMAAAMIATGGYTIGLKEDSILKTIGIFEVAVGLSGGAWVAGQKNKED